LPSRRRSFEHGQGKKSPGRGASDRDRGRVLLGRSGLGCHPPSDPRVERDEPQPCPPRSQSPSVAAPTLAPSHETHACHGATRLPLSHPQHRSISPRHHMAPLGREHRLHDRFGRPSRVDVHAQPGASCQHPHQRLPTRSGGRDTPQREALGDGVLLRVMPPGAAERSRGTLGRLPHAKSSGSTSSRKALNFSTSSSSSPGMRIEASSRTSSLAKIGAAILTARAIASEGLEEMA
jgi:hypothetical protein